MPRCIFSSRAILAVAVLWALSARGELLTEPTGDEELRRIRDRIETLQNATGELDANMTLLREHLRNLVQGVTIGYRNALYAKVGFSIMGARPSTFVTPPAAYGTGLFVAFGRYFGRHHILEIEMATDIYLAAALRYHLEFHMVSPSLSFGPVVGYKARVGEMILQNKFLFDKPRPGFLVLGFQVGIPIGRTAITLEVDYLANRQALIFSSAGIQMFF